jgi:hypothetical protein
LYRHFATASIADFCSSEGPLRNSVFLTFPSGVISTRRTTVPISGGPRVDLRSFALPRLLLLNALDTREAIRERVQLMGLMSKEEISLERQSGGGSLLRQPLLESSTRPELVVESMETRAEGPNFGVDYDYVDWWAKYIILRDHVELLRPFPDEAEHQKRIHSFFEYEVAAKQDILLRLESSLTSKKGAAKDITTLTIKGVKADIAYQLDAKSKMR